MVFDEGELRHGMADQRIRSYAALARRVQLSPSYMRQIGSGFVPSPEVRERIASAIGRDAGRIWYEVVTVPPLR